MYGSGIDCWDICLYFLFFFKGFFFGGWGGVTQPNFLLSREIMSFFWGFNLMFEDIDLVC